MGQAGTDQAAALPSQVTLDHPELHVGNDHVRCQHDTILGLADF